MAGGHSDDGGTMDISEHRRTWAGFVKFIEWSMGGIIVIMVLLAIFRTH